MRMEVRCCCQPQKLLGTVEVPDGTKAGTMVTFPLKSIIYAHTGWTDPCAHDQPENLTLWARTFMQRRMQGYPAIKAEHVTLDVLRRVPSFQEYSCEDFDQR